MAGSSEVGGGGAAVEQAAARLETSVLLGAHSYCEGDAACSGERGGGRAPTTWALCA